MNHTQRLANLASLNWIHDEKSGRHSICNERCGWIAGKIGDVEWSAWLSEVSGMVYLHGVAPSHGEYDFAFDAFCELVRVGWKVKKTATAVRSLFGDE